MYYTVIAQTEAQGLCGSGLIDIIGELLRIGLIDSIGRLLTKEEAMLITGSAIAGRLREGEKENEFVLAELSDSRGLVLHREIFDRYNWLKRQF